MNIMKVCRKIKSRGNIRIFLCRHLQFCKASRKQPTGLGIIKVPVDGSAEGKAVAGDDTRKTGECEN